MINQLGLVILAKTFLLGNQGITIFSVKEKFHTMEHSDPIMEKLMLECRKMVILWYLFNSKIKKKKLKKINFIKIIFYNYHLIFRSTLIKTNHYGI